MFTGIQLINTILITATIAIYGQYQVINKLYQADISEFSKSSTETLSCSKSGKWKGFYF